MIFVNLLSANQGGVSIEHGMLYAPYF